MNFLILEAASGLILAFLPLYLARRLKTRWKMPDKLFFRAGMFLLLIVILHMAVAGNGVSTFPQFFSMEIVWQALIQGLLAGLFFELGRYVALDKFFPKVRGKKEAIYFALGWNGVGTFLYGILLFVGVFAVNALINATDLAATFGTATPKDLEQLKVFQDQALQLVAGNPLIALAPLLERASLALTDIAMTLLVVQCFQKGTTKFAWAAVAFRAVFVALLYVVANYDPIAGEIVFLAFGLISLRMIAQSKKKQDRL